MYHSSRNSGAMKTDLLISLRGVLLVTNRYASEFNFAHFFYAIGYYKDLGFHLCKAVLIRNFLSKS